MPCEMSLSNTPIRSGGKVESREGSMSQWWTLPIGMFLAVVVPSLGGSVIGLVVWECQLLGFGDFASLVNFCSRITNFRIYSQSREYRQSALYCEYYTNFETSSFVCKVFYFTKLNGAS